MDELERHLTELLRSSPGSDARDLRRRASERLPGREVSRKDVNRRLYRGLSRGVFRRSEGQRPRWYLASSPSASTAGDAGDRRTMVGRSLEELARELGLDPRDDGKLAFRKVGEQVAAAAGQRGTGATLRVIRTGSGCRPREDVQFGNVRFADLVATSFERSPVRRSLESVRFIVFAEAAPRERSVLLADVVWSPTGAQMEAMEGDYEAARDAIAQSDMEALPRGDTVRFLRYGTKANDSSDVDSLPDGTRVTRRGFYLVKRALEPVLRSLIGHQPSTAQDPVRRREDEGPHEALLLGLLEEQLRSS